MTWRSGALLLLVGAVMILSCDDTDGNGGQGGRGGTAATGGGGAGGGGAGGTGGTGGGGGAGGTGGTGGTSSDARESGGETASSAADCFPACIAQIRRDCRRPTMGSCVHEVWNDADNYCYSNGVKETKQSPPFVPSTRTTFRTPAGAVCYSTEVVSPTASTTVEVVFKNANGAEVARGKRGVADTRWQITCGGQTTEVDEASAACGSVLPGQCTDGTCR